MVIMVKVIMDYKYFITSTLVDIDLRVFQRGGRVTGIFFTPIKFFKNSKSIVPQTTSMNYPAGVLYQYTKMGT